MQFAMTMTGCSEEAGTWRRQQCCCGSWQSTAGAAESDVVAADTAAEAATWCDPRGPTSACRRQVADRVWPARKTATGRDTKTSGQQTCFLHDFLFHCFIPWQFVKKVLLVCGFLWSGWYAALKVDSNYFATLSIFLLDVRNFLFVLLVYFFVVALIPP